MIFLLKYANEANAPESVACPDGNEYEDSFAKISIPSGLGLAIISFKKPETKPENKMSDIIMKLFLSLPIQKSHADRTNHIPGWPK